MGISIVIGGTKGLGRSITDTLEKKGEKVVVVSRTPIDNMTAKHYQVNLNSLVENHNEILRIPHEQGKISNLIFSQKFRGDQSSKDEFNISLDATDTIIKTLLPFFETTGFPSIVILGSPAGRFIVEEQPLTYHTSKAALEQLAKFYAVRLGNRNIRVNCVMPGTVLKNENIEFYQNNNSIKTLLAQTIPLKRMGTSKEVADVVSYLCSPQSSYLTGQCFFVDGGLSLLGQESVARQVAGLDIPKNKSN